MCAVDVGPFVSSLKQLGASHSRSSSIQQLRQVSLMHFEPSLGCVPSLYYYACKFNTESYCRSIMSTFQYHTLSPLESDLWVWVACLALQYRWDGFKHQFD